MNRYFLLVFFLLALTFNKLATAEGAGISLTYAGIKVDVRYNDNVYDKISGMDYIREPSGALFDLIYLLQNSNIKENMEIEAQIDNHGGSLWIYKSKPVKKVILEIDNLNHLDSNQIIKTFCNELNTNSCSTNKESKIDLYLSDSNLDNETYDLVEFGCFPCSKDRSIAISNAIHSNIIKNKPNFKKVTADKESIFKYFNVLRD